MTVTSSFITALPKVELHLHIEGSLEPELMVELAGRNRIEIPFGSVSEVEEAYKFNNLQDFLDIYYQGMNVLQTERDFEDLTAAYLDRVASQNVRHVEIFFDPQGHTDRGVSFETVVTGITRALESGQARHGITYRLILCFLRHLTEESALATLEQATPFASLIHGVGLDSSEQGFPPSLFKLAFARAGELGWFKVAHAGEEGPPEYVWEALKDLGVARVDHGNRALEDDSLITELVTRRIPLTVCPLSNLKLCVVDDMRQHPLRRMLDLGLCATVNSDDPSYFGGYMNENFEAVATALDLDGSHLLQLTRNAVSASFADEDRKEALFEELDAFAASQL